MQETQGNSVPESAFGQHRMHEQFEVNWTGLRPAVEMLQADDDDYTIGSRKTAKNGHPPAEHDKQETDDTTAPTIYGRQKPPSGLVLGSLSSCE